MDDWRADETASELWSLIDMVWAVEEMEISQIRTLCDDNGISCEKFIECWEALLDESHVLIHQAESKIF